jgi:hypothetical protein
MCSLGTRVTHGTRGTRVTRGHRGLCSKSGGKVHRFTSISLDLMHLAIQVQAAAPVLSLLKPI